MHACTQNPLTNGTTCIAHTWVRKVALSTGSTQVRAVHFRCPINLAPNLGQEQSASFSLRCHHCGPTTPLHSLTATLSALATVCLSLAVFRPHTHTHARSHRFADIFSSSDHQPSITAQHRTPARTHAALLGLECFRFAIVSMFATCWHFLLPAKHLPVQLPPRSLTIVHFTTRHGFVGERIF